MTKHPASAASSSHPPLVRARGPERVAPAEAMRRVTAGQAVIVDCREPDEWSETGVVAGAATLSLGGLRAARADWTRFLATHRDKQIILYCLSGTRSSLVARALAAEGYHTADAGGLHDWLAAGRKLVPWTA